MAKEKQKKSAEIKVRVTPQFKTAFKKKAVELNLSMSQLVEKSYVRIDDKISRKVIHQADPKLIYEVAKIGGNINQIARSLNQGSEFTLETLAILKSIERSLEELKNVE